MDDKFYRDQLVNTAERLIDLSDRLKAGSTPLNREERKLFRVGMSSHVQDVLQEAHCFYLLNSNRDLKASLTRIIEFSEAINL